jgi:hypothetical protein
MVKAITDKGKIMTILGLSLITVSVLFIGSAYISLNGVVNVKIAYDFNIENDIIVTMLDEDTFEASNETFSRQDALDWDIRFSLLTIPYDIQMSNLNKTEINKFITNTTRYNNQFRFDNMYQSLNIITPSFQKVRSLEFFMKLGSSNRIAFITWALTFKRDGFIDADIIFYGFINDNQDSLKNIGKDKTIITINRIAFDESSFSEFYNFMADDITNQNIPSVYPYQISFNIEKTYQSLTDMLRSA